MDIDNMKNVRIDKEEFIKQNNEKIRKSGNYAEVSILVEKDSNCLMPYIGIHKVGIKEVAYLIDALKHTSKELEKRYPEAVFYANFMMRSEKKDLYEE